MKISKAANLVVTWTGGVEGTVEVGVDNDDAGVLDTIIACSAPAAAGSLSVPATLLTMLGTKGYFQSSAQNATTKQVDDWTMQFQATTRNEPIAVTYTK